MDYNQLFYVFLRIQFSQAFLRIQHSPAHEVAAEILEKNKHLPGHSSFLALPWVRLGGPARTEQATRANAVGNASGRGGRRGSQDRAGAGDAGGQR